jgi:hypothetical protein
MPNGIAEAHLDEKYVARVAGSKERNSKTAGHPSPRCTGGVLVNENSGDACTLQVLLMQSTISIH